MGFLKKLSRRQKTAPDEHRNRLLTNGRITDGVIIDTYTAPDGSEVAHYTYTLNGVDFESSDRLTPEQLRDPIKYAPGARVGVRYDPKNQGNSILE